MCCGDKINEAALVCSRCSVLTILYASRLYKLTEMWRKILCLALRILNGLRICGEYAKKSISVHITSWIRTVLNVMSRIYSCFAMAELGRQKVVHQNVSFVYARRNKSWNSTLLSRKYENYAHSRFILSTLIPMNSQKSSWNQLLLKNTGKV